MPARPGRNGAHTSASASGARSARTTARTATPGTTSRTSRRDPVPTAGAKTDLAASATTSSGCASRLALWNGRDPILKERLFGLTNSEGNHGEDVKEYYFYLDSTPTHSYMKFLYKYPQAAFPYADLVQKNSAAQPQRTGIRTARHRSLRRRPLLRRVRRVREGGPRRCPRAHHRAQPRAGRGVDPPAADTLVPQYVVMGEGRRAPAALRRRRERDRRAPRRARQARTRLRWRPDAALHREREQQPAPFWQARTSRPA